MFVLFYSSQRKGNFIEAPGSQSSARRLPYGQGGGGGALFNLGMQVVGVATLLVADDSAEV